MDFSKTKEQLELIEGIKDFVKQNITEEKLKQWYANRGVPDELTRAYLDAGFGYLGFPEELGGTPATIETLCMITEELSRAAGAQLPFLQNTIAMYDMVELGSPDQIKLAMETYNRTGKAFFSIAITEPQAGSDNSAMTTTAKRVDGKIVINGHKTFITNGEEFPYILVVAKDEDPSVKNKNMSMWLVDKDAPGITKTTQYKIMQQIMPISDIVFDNVVIEESSLVGERGKGFVNLMKNLEIERLMTCAVCLGLAQGAMDDAADYAGKRVAFGQSIGMFQQIQQKLTDMEVKLRNMKGIVYQTAWEMDQKQSVQLSNALAKRYVPATAVEVCSDAMQIMGGIGMTPETRVGRMWMDSRMNQVLAGTDEIMVHIAGRKLLKIYAKD